MFYEVVAYQILRVTKAVGDEEVVEGLLGLPGSGVARGLGDEDLGPVVLLGVGLLLCLVLGLGLALEIG